MNTPTPWDYERDPERYRRGMRQAGARSGASLYDTIAAVLADAGATLVADVGCAEGALAAAVGAGATVLGLDTSATMLAAHPRPAVLADAVALPLRSATMHAVATVNTFDHLADPLPALVEARRALAPGGLFVAGAISRSDSPEFAAHWRPPPSPFDAEDAPELVRDVFGEVEVRGWDAPLVRLSDADAVRDYLRTRFAAPEVVEAAVAECDPPLWITKRGALLLARVPDGGR